MVLMRLYRTRLGIVHLFSCSVTRKPSVCANSASRPPRSWSGPKVWSRWSCQTQPRSPRLRSMGWKARSRPPTTWNRRSTRPRSSSTPSSRMPPLRTPWRRNLPSSRRPQPRGPPHRYQVRKSAEVGGKALEGKRWAIDFCFQNEFVLM